MLSFFFSCFYLFAKYVYLCLLKKDQIILYCADVRFLKKIIYILRFHLNLNYFWLLDIYCIDFFNQHNRFCITWMVHNFNIRVFVRVFLREFTMLPSIVDIYSSAVWLEREVYDMFGIFFYNNMDLRRILTDYGFVGFPLRKDFPLTGFVEIKYDDYGKRIVVEPVMLSQEFRFFEFLNPWVMVAYVN